MSIAIRTRVKICGITRLEDALQAEASGVDALGFVFCKASSRYITPVAARLLTGQLPPFITRVGLFLDASDEEVEEAITAIPELVLQFHGRESASACERFDRPYLKALGVGSSGMPGVDTLQEYEHALGFLYDSNEPGQLGGTGHVFDWGRLSGQHIRPLILAGGLHPQNVEAAIAQVRPYGVDVSTGVESAKGIKNKDAIREFTAAVRRADAQLKQVGENQ